MNTGPSRSERIVGKPLSILFCGLSETVKRAAQKELARSETRFDSREIANLSEFRAALVSAQPSSDHPDNEHVTTILFHEDFPDADPFTALTLLQEAGYEWPFIVLQSGKPAGAASLLRAGASDVLDIAQMDRLTPVIEREAERCTLRNELAQTRTTLHQTFDSLNEAVFIVNGSDRTIQYCNPAAERVFGYSRDELQGRDASCLHASRQEYEDRAAAALQALEETGYYVTNSRLRCKNGTVVDTVNVSTLRDLSKGPAGGDRMRHTGYQRAETVRRGTGEANRSPQ